MFFFISEEITRINLSQEYDIKEEITFDHEFDTIDNNFDFEEPFQDYDGCNKMDYQSELDYESESHLSPSKSEQFSPKINLVPKDMDPKVVLQRLTDSDMAMINNNEEQMHQSLMCDNCEEFFDTSRVLRQHKKTCDSQSIASPISQSKDSIGTYDVPEHEFIYSNPTQGNNMNRWIVTLVIPPYTFSRHSQTKEKGTAKFLCNGCQSLPKRHSTSATAEMTNVDEEGRQKYMKLE